MIYILPNSLILRLQFLAIDRKLLIFIFNFKLSYIIYIFLADKQVTELQNLFPW